jgi:hypothetical protein
VQVIVNRKLGSSFSEIGIPVLRVRTLRRYLERSYDPDYATSDSDSNAQRKVLVIIKTQFWNVYSCCKLYE